jgi:hypothetical protein
MFYHILLITNMFQLLLQPSEHILSSLMPNRQISSYNKNYPDDDHKSNRNMLVINNVIKHILYMCICWFYYISLNIKFIFGQEVKSVF